VTATLRDGRRWLRAACVAAVLCSTTIAEAQTQPRPSTTRKTWEFGGGVTWTTQTPFGSADANERDPTGAPFRLFALESQLDSTFGAQLYISPRLTRSLRLELAGRYGAPHLTASVTKDVENAADAVIDETIMQLSMDGALLYEFGPDLPTRGTVPFVFGGAGFSRELHDGQTLVETGQAYFGGAGVKGFFMRGRVRRSIGLRFDARVVMRMNGVALDDKSHIGAVFTASFFKQF
jgi:hypothetical protein